MNIAILGGSFDPVHEGHIQMAKDAYKQLNVDEVWLMPSKDTPLKDRGLTSFYHRYKMCEIAIQPYSYMQICTIENEMEGKSYTIRTMETLTEMYPDCHFYFMMGEDQVAQLDKWKDIDKLQDLVTLCAFARNGKEIQTSYKVKPLWMKATPYSSSDVRSGKYNQVCAGVRKYMIEHQLYFDFVKDCMSTYRYEHSLRVALLCRQIARENGMDADKAYLCGLLHDINKEFTLINKEDSEHIISLLCPELLDMNPSIWHGFMGAYVCNHKLGIHDKDILYGIENHVLGRCKNKYAMVVYVADKLDPNRDYDTYPTIQLCCKNIYAGYKEVMKQQKEFYGEE